MDQCNAPPKLTTKYYSRIQTQSVGGLCLCSKMVSLFQVQAQAQASTKIAATKDGVYVNSVTISSILVANINSRASKIQP
jgi:hypothetical protein